MQMSLWTDFLAILMSALCRYSFSVFSLTPRGWIVMLQISGDEDRGGCQSADVNECVEIIVLR